MCAILQNENDLRTSGKTQLADNYVIYVKKSKFNTCENFNMCFLQKYLFSKCLTVTNNISTPKWDPVCDSRS